MEAWATSARPYAQHPRAAHPAPPGYGHVTIVPSATGIGLFAIGSGAGDDLSGWRIRDTRVSVTEVPWTSQFDDPTSRNLRRRSTPGDPAPLVPGKGAGQGYGADLAVVQIRAFVDVQRLSTYYLLAAIVPVILCVVITLLTHVIDADLVETRLQLVVALFLSLTALQIVFEGDLPKSSYILPTGQLVIASYCVMVASFIESLVAFNVHSWPDVRAYWAGMAAGRSVRRNLSRRTRARPSLARSVTTLLAAVNKAAPGGRLAPRPGARFARGAAPTDSDSGGERGCASAAGPAPDAAAARAARAAAVKEDLDRSYWNWVAWVLDLVTLGVLTVREERIGSTARGEPAPEHPPNTLPSLLPLSSGRLYPHHRAHLRARRRSVAHRAAVT